MGGCRRLGVWKSKSMLHLQVSNIGRELFEIILEKERESF